MNILSQYKLGDLELSNRMVMAPMTRCRAIEGNVPNPLSAIYYTQRASAGLIITEGSQVSKYGVGYVNTPGIHSPLQVAGWKKVTEAVHKARKNFPSTLACTYTAGQKEFCDPESSRTSQVLQMCLQ